MDERYALLCAALIFSMDVALAAGPAEKWAQYDPATREWFNSLRNPNTSIPCCSFADGTKVDDPDYRENPDGSYEVFLFGKWNHVGKDKVINPPGRKVQYAIIWWNPSVDHPYCFMPGVSY